MVRALFYVTLGLLLYSYLLYPVVLLLLPARKRCAGADNIIHPFKSACWPSIAVLVTAYNEQEVIAEKIRNFLACDYPGPSEMVIVSDGSSDRTVEVAAGLAGDRVHIITLPRRCGKTAAINRAFQKTRGEIVVFSDANALFALDALTELVRPFADPRIGLVTGGTNYIGAVIGSVYQRYEQFLKRLEARGGVVATADGAIYAMRRTLWQEHDESLALDFLHPIVATLQGAGGVIAPKAVCFEDFSLGNEFDRQVRMVSCAAAVYLRFIPKLLRARHWRSILVLTSHKMLRWLTAPLLGLLVSATTWLAPAGGIYEFVLVAEAVFTGLALGGWLAKTAGVGDERTAFAYQFVALNFAGALGFCRCLAGRVPVTWQPRNR